MILRVYRNDAGEVERVVLIERATPTEGVVLNVKGEAVAVVPLKGRER